MNGFILTLGLGLLAVLLPAVGVAWWEHRKRSLDAQTRRSGAEASRRAPPRPEVAPLARAAAASDTEPQVMPAAAPITAAAPPTAQTLPPSRAAAAALAAAAEPVATAPEVPARGQFDGPGWAETAPMTGMGTEPSFAETMPAELHFAQTMPAELDLGEPPARTGKPRQPA